MLLALLAVSVMLLGTYFLGVFGRDVTGLLQKWSSKPAAGASSGRRHAR